MKWKVFLVIIATTLTPTVIKDAIRVDYGQGWVAYECEYFRDTIVVDFTNQDSAMTFMKLQKNATVKNYENRYFDSIWIQ